MAYDAAVSAAASAMARKRIASMTKTEIKALMSKAGKASWSKLSPEERRIEMRRRCAVRRKNKMKRAKLLRVVK